MFSFYNYILGLPAWSEYKLSKAIYPVHFNFSLHTSLQFLIFYIYSQFRLARLVWSFLHSLNSEIKWFVHLFCKCWVCKHMSLCPFICIIKYIVHATERLSVKITLNKYVWHIKSVSPVSLHKMHFIWNFLGVLLLQCIRNSHAVHIINISCPFLVTIVA